MRRLYVMVLLLVLPLGGGCAHLGKRFEPRPEVPVANSTNPAFEAVDTGARITGSNLQPPTEPYRLGTSDLVEIEILGEGDTRRECKVMPDGMLYYHTVPGFVVTGMTLPELKAHLETSLAEYYRNVQVSVVLRGVSSQRVWVLGRVNSSGLYPLFGPMTVLEAISKAGGLFTSRFSGTTEELADLSHSFIVRDGEYIPVDFYKLLQQGDLSQNIYLKNGDYIYIPSALNQQLFVLGAVNSPKAMGYNNQVTLAQALSDAKGLLPNAYTQRIVIVRGSLNKPTVATVNLSRILAGKDKDVLLRPGDIVWVPNSPWERVDTYTKMIINSFVRTVAANEGGRAVSSEAAPVESSISITP